MPTIHLFSQRSLLPWIAQLSKFGRIANHSGLDELRSLKVHDVRLLLIDLTITSEHEVLDFCNDNLASTVAIFGSQISVQFAVALMHAGAIPFVGGSDTERCLEYIHACWVKKRSLFLEYQALSECINQLSADQFSTFRQMLLDLPNKRIAKTLGIAERTVESRRAKIFECFKVESLVQLTRALHKYALLQEMFEPDARLKAADIDRSLGMPTYTALSTLQFRAASEA